MACQSGHNQPQTTSPTPWPENVYFHISFKFCFLYFVFHNLYFVSSYFVLLMVSQSGHNQPQTTSPTPWPENVYFHISFKFCFLYFVFHNLYFVSSYFVLLMVSQSGHNQPQKPQHLGRNTQKTLKHYVNMIGTQCKDDLNIMYDN